MPTLQERLDAARKAQPSKTSNPLQSRLDEARKAPANDDEDSILRLAIVIMFMLQLLNMVLAICDFSIFMVNAQNDADSLYNVTSVDTYKNWCVSVSDNATTCIDDARGITNDGTLSRGTRSELSMVVVVVVAMGIGLVVLMRGR